jgi:hypothetical protein
MKMGKVERTRIERPTRRYDSSLIKLLASTHASIYLYCCTRATGRTYLLLSRAYRCGSQSARCDTNTDICWTVKEDATLYRRLIHSSRPLVVRQSRVFVRTPPN